MRKIYRNPVFTFFLGTLLAGSTAYAAYKIHAREVSYTPENESFQVVNVNSALDSLYEKYQHYQFKFLASAGNRANVNANIHSDELSYITEESGDLLFIVSINMSANLQPNAPHLISDNPDCNIELIENYDIAMQVSGNYGHAYSYSYKISNITSGNKITVSTNNPRVYGNDAGGIDTVTLGYQVYKIG